MMMIFLEILGLFVALIALIIYGIVDKIKEIEHKRAYETEERNKRLEYMNGGKFQAEMEKDMEDGWKPSHIWHYVWEKMQDKDWAPKPEFERKVLEYCLDWTPSKCSYTLTDEEAEKELKFVEWLRIQHGEGRA
jgi:hypothetical protein